MKEETSRYRESSKGATTAAALSSRLPSSPTAPFPPLLAANNQSRPSNESSWIVCHRTTATTSDLPSKSPKCLHSSSPSDILPYGINHLLTPCRWKFRPIMLSSIVAKQPDIVLRPYLLSELATMSGYWSYEFAPMKRSYHVPIGRQQGTYKLCHPEAMGIPTVPYPWMLCRPYSSTRQTSISSLGHPRMPVLVYSSTKGCSKAATPLMASD